MKKIGFMRFRSALSAGDKTLRKEEEEFLHSIDPEKEFSFVKPQKGLPNVFFIQTGGSEIYFKDCYQEFEEPYCLLVQGKRNSLAASLEIKTFLARQGKRCFLISGTPEECLMKLRRYEKFYQIEKQLKNTRLGLIGKPSDWLIGSETSFRDIKKKFGIEIVPIQNREFLDAYEERLLSDTKAYKHFLEKTSRREDLRKSLYVHGALHALVKKYDLSGFSLRCFDLVQAKQQTSCLAFAMLNDEGITATCEGDVPSLLTMHLIHLLTGGTSFMANPSEIDVAHKKALFAHCTCPLSMVSSYTLATHFESGLGFGIRGTFPKGKMTAAKIHPSLDSIRALPCDLESNPMRADLCRSQIILSFPGGVEELLDNPYGNHMIFAYGDIVEELKALFDYLTKR